MRKILLTFVVLSILSIEVSAQAFIDKGYHPKSIAVGRAVTASTGDASLLFYNPASIGFLSTGHVFTGFSNLYPDITDENMNLITGGGAYSLGSIGTVGVVVSQFSPNFWNEQMFIGSFATRMFLEDLSVGGSVKILRWSAEAPQGQNAVPEPVLSYTGFTLDVGATYIATEVYEENDIQIGVSLLNITQPSVASNASPDGVLPMEVHLGGAYVSRKFNYSVLSGIVVREGEMKIMLGSEINALKTSIAGIESMFLVRFGGGRVAEIDSQGEYNVGFGLKISSFVFDYSYSYQAFSNHVGGISSISLGYEF
ncbi:MAG: type IX secretion system membrane protein PorP/SprF [Ignavibacteriales bacterium]|nr:type IX secretion system membrane protein PorP/SprF [Ignavibacteriales bacterium]